MKKKSFLVVLIFGSLFSSCNDKNIDTNSENDKHQNFVDNYYHYDDDSNNTDSIIDSANRVRTEQNYSQREQNQFSYIKKSYIIVHLVVQQNNGRAYDEYGILHYNRPQELNVVSSVQEIENVDEITKAKLKDAVISNYLNSMEAKMYQGRIKSAEVFEFDSYIEASDKRSSYLVEE